MYPPRTFFASGNDHRYRHDHNQHRVRDAVLAGGFDYKEFDGGQVDRCVYADDRRQSNDTSTPQIVDWRLIRVDRTEHDDGVGRHSERRYRDAENLRPFTTEHGIAAA